MRLRKSSVIMTILVTLMSGCGYTTKAVLPDSIKTIHVAIFTNNIDITREIGAKDKYEVYRPDLEVTLRDAMVERIFLDGHLKSASKSSGDAMLEGEIKEYRKDPLRYQDETVREYRISLVCDFKLIDSKDSEIILERRNIIGDTTYFTTGSLEKTETQALKDAASDLARRIVNAIVENW